MDYNSTSRLTVSTKIDHGRSSPTKRRSVKLLQACEVIEYVGLCSTELEVHYIPGQLDRLRGQGFGCGRRYPSCTQETTEPQQL
jgi:hypothetical protein